ncbi:hypothetical protein U0358_06465 [Idiomarina sp. PL1-037]|uniref:hypothetical protein n=1 Tax=Idiomarina sp. PL1-037 TaxID=3095365 RepID=UPI002ACC2508|nr:hypothetical protein [Idiomarina sp. PL1-037]WQC54193.1 hypothetical protein U0358_06465 [Idiomarina sp. PL1-037]
MSELRIKIEENTSRSWVAAIDSWDYCDPKPLSLMIQKHGVPSELNQLVAAIISGDRKQKTKANSSKIDANQRMMIAETYLSIRQVPESVLAKRTAPNYEEVADKNGEEIKDELIDYRGSQRRYDEKVAKMLGVSPRTLKSLISEYREKIKNYPNL